MMKYIHFIEQKEKAAFLQSVRAFRHLPVGYVNSMASVMRWQTVEAGAELITQGKAINDVYFIVDGTCQAFCSIVDPEFFNPLEILLGEYKRSELIGEEAVLRDRQLAADQPVNGRVKLVRILNHVAYIRLIFRVQSRYAR
jgi:CRP-like cAMP-binding protein